jgi:hypothetical protein
MNFASGPKKKLLIYFSPSLRFLHARGTAEVHSGGSISAGGAPAEVVGRPASAWGQRWPRTCPGMAVAHLAMAWRGPATRARGLQRSGTATGSLAGEAELEQVSLRTVRRSKASGKHGLACGGPR